MSQNAATTEARAGLMVTDVDRKTRAPSPAAEIRSFLTALVEVLQAPLRLLGFSLHLGIRQELSRVPVVDALPRRLVELLMDGDEVRVSVLSDAVGAARLAAAFTVWRLPAKILPTSRWCVTDESRAAVATALRDCPVAPTAVIEAGPVVVALWFFAEALDLQADQARALTLQRRLAERLGAEVEAGQDLSAGLPLPGGAVRNWDKSPVEFARFDVLDTGRRYTIDQLEQAVSAPAPAGPAARRRDRT